jgi:hypothetical protein
VVTGRFAHSSADVIDLAVDGLAAPIGTTSNHRFWSEDRQAFVEAGSLAVGERLRTADGRFVPILGAVARSQSARVFNLEVDGEHVYHVSEAGVLVHNKYARFRRWRLGEPIDKPMSNGSRPSWKTVQSRYWKNRAAASRQSNEFSRSNLRRMRRGSAPQDYNPRTGRWESRELHHVNPQRYAGEHSPLNLRELTPDWHAEVDPFRYIPGIHPIRGTQ